MSTQRYALATAAAIFVLLLFGTVVHATGSSLACPDWPLCYGQVFPAMHHGVEFEHSHRLVAAAVGLLTLVLAGLLRRRHRDDAGLQRLALLAIVLVCLQGTLGGLTVLLRLPLIVSTTHLATSMAFFGLMIHLAFRLDRAPPAPRGPVPFPVPLRRWIGLAAGAVYLQLVLGALVRHTASGLACNTDIPLCNGRLWPVWNVVHPWNGPAQLHLLHRGWALVAATLVVAVAMGAARAARRHGAPRVLALARLAYVLVTVQILLGMLTVWSRIDVFGTAAHLGVAALLWADTLALYLATGPRAATAGASRREAWA